MLRSERSVAEPLAALAREAARPRRSSRSSNWPTGCRWGRTR